jgi:hypothetical protein
MFSILIENVVAVQWHFDTRNTVLYAPDRITYNVYIQTYRSMIKSMATLRIIDVKPNSPVLHDVIALGDENSETLGFLSRETYRHYAEKGSLFAAIEENGTLVGYVIYRTLRKANYAVIVHFCVSTRFRGPTSINLLFDALRDRTKLLNGLFLKCRRDFKNPTQMWQHLGFQPIGEVRGRGKQETTLTKWWYQHPHASLFDLRPADDEQILVTIDGPIFFDLCDPSATPESQALVADWLPTQLEYLITPELSNEINTVSSKSARQAYKKREQSYGEAKATIEDFKTKERELRTNNPDLRSANVSSSLKHLAWMIADSRSRIFVTKNEELLAVAFGIHAHYQVRILRPSDLILHLDELSRMSEYQHMRLAGTDLNIRQIKSQEDTQLAGIFHVDSETTGDFLHVLRVHLTNPTAATCYVVEDGGLPLALFVYRRVDNDLDVPLFRINSELRQKVLVRYLLLRFITKSAGEGRLFTIVTDGKLHPEIEEALQEDIFQRVGTSWIKPNLAIVAKGAEVADMLDKALDTHTDLRPYYETHLQVLRQPTSLEDAKLMSDIERILHPAKIADANLPAVLIPIDDTWMSMWFDEELASGTLFGADRQRALNREGVYYSKAKRGGLLTPGRILWYVKKNENVSGTSCVRASARLDEIVVGPANEMFQQYKELGILEWQQLLKYTGNQPDAHITVFRFSDLELFKQPVDKDTLFKIYNTVTGKDSAPIYSPSAIPTPVFIQVYRLGMALS